MSVEYARINNTLGKNELGIMAKYDPQCLKLCNNVFNESYKMRREFEQFRLVCEGKENHK